MQNIPKTQKQLFSASPLYSSGATFGSFAVKK